MLDSLSDQAFDMSNAQHIAHLCFMALGLAAHISVTPTTGATKPPTIPLAGALPLAGPSAPPPLVLTSMDGRISCQTPLGLCPVGEGVSDIKILLIAIATCIGLSMSFHLR